MPRIFSKDVDETLDVTVDWENFMNDVGSPSDTISSSVWEIPSGITNSGSSFEVDLATVLLSGGTAGKTYKIKNQVVTTLGYTLERTVYLRVVDDEEDTLTSALTVEDGSIVANANSYISLAYADAFQATRFNSAWFDFTVPEREAAIVKATDYMLAAYTGKWKGMRVDYNQTLDWPRAGVISEDFKEPVSGARFGFPGMEDLTFLVPEDEVPDIVKQANAILAFEQAYNGDLLPSTKIDTGNVKRAKAGSVEVEYFGSAQGPQVSGQTKTFPQVEKLLSKLFEPRYNRLVRV